MRDLFLGLGSNLGDRAAYISLAWQGFSAIPGVQAIALSTVLDTAPVGGPVGQPRFLNAVAHFQTSLSAATLLAHALRIEADHGRERAVLQGPRTIDIDILILGDETHDLPHLVIPHPRMHLRDFVMKPLAEIAPSVAARFLAQTRTAFS
ncbi:MAG: 2-amino-4-hydroxy-6-hydroxymethyldihydropteridine diphosphokinase [Planctomycetes bacterium]|jgi:2-amino-4-hydroxy-6-hydroxymethyldihydropteridine diphosphokinase|nr:2-amino-4-hydroxy-6-hydroxymethyldihydropteridine diphosphokinase [Planctomycetota bacterium]MBT4560413.1 2-amino-4-hydroxy-6-hydroxymethyldihydropteridine diphosphokinase [Planctomycetota bacterium]MBT5101136.1 2-amino-4-hydroxy-6-hydroxymethyldihydropteridine diphosphokinase [Planctomycetota bacterium]MBT5120659.1 2-amino-4-hydroxy-6-hydroxymethyldihydropteridine diphosphokinase [Planctomycetota bacterium]